VLLLLLFVVGGCDPLFTMQFRQALAPAPEESCIAAALRSSPLAAVVWQDTAARHREGGYVVTVRDSLVPGGAWQLHVEQGGKPGSVWVQASYSYPGFATPPRDVRARWAAQARVLLDGVRARCGAAAPLDVRCHNVGFIGGQRGACVAPSS
jgi:hypothetical protein